MRTVSVKRMQKIDKIAIERIGIPRVLLMDHAGTATASSAAKLIKARKIRVSKNHPIVICCGSGYNGGDGLSAARHLANWGYPVHVVLAGRINRLREEPLLFAHILKKTKVSISEIRDNKKLHTAERLISKSSLLIDALLGIGVKGDVRQPTFDIITHINKINKPVISADIPSGLNADTGKPQRIAVRATYTISFGLAKKGLKSLRAKSFVGKVLVNSITIPEFLLKG